MSVLSSLIQKEVTQLRRNPFLSKLVFAFPIVVMLIIHQYVFHVQSYIYSFKFRKL